MTFVLTKLKKFKCKGRALAAVTDESLLFSVAEIARTRAG